MFRIALLFILPLILPAFLYAAGRKAFRIPVEKPYPVKILFFSGLILTVLSLSFFSVSDRAEAGSRYVPPRYVNGRIIPAHMDSGPHAD